MVTSTADTPGLLLWDLRSGKQERSLPTDGPVLSLDVSAAAAASLPDCLCCIIHASSFGWTVLAIEAALETHAGVES